MVEQSIIDSIKRYLKELVSCGIHPSQAVLFGSFAAGKANEFSDIDLVVIAPEFDGTRTVPLVKALWRATIADNRIEPIPCGEKEWVTNQSRPILEIARKDGVIIK
jgi:predicted nucleotidyltransferase